MPLFRSHMKRGIPLPILCIYLRPDRKEIIRPIQIAMKRRDMQQCVPMCILDIDISAFVYAGFDVGGRPHL